MKERPKLGRGLEDISSHFLSPQHPRDPQPEDRPSSVAQNCTIAVCHPASGIMQSCVVTNLALELAKRQHPVMIQDFLPPGEASIRTLMGTIVTQDEQAPDQAIIRLYGLPEIVVAEAAPGLMWKGPGTLRDTRTNDKCYMVNLGNTIDFIMGSDAVRDYILITQADEKPLLQAYAFLKTMHVKNSQAGLHLVMDDAPSRADAERLFNRFNSFVRKQLGMSVGFLGNLIQDESLQRSIVERRPLVLARDRGETGMAAICARFLDTLEQGDNRPSEAD